MVISSGTRLGPYEIIRSLGAGGMGEVWRARDTRLGRDVAIKVLPRGFADNENFQARFEREARVISRLNHPFICTLHDIGEENGHYFLVMELLEGESLEDRLRRGPLPLRDVLRYGRQIASALGSAHRSGVTHRDLKPSNVIVTKSGAKLLDFGLAKEKVEEPPDEGLPEKPTVQRPLTDEGTVVGTLQYMSPEQLEGRQVDARTDIFALGVLIQEMATGKPAFRGTTRTSLIASILSTHPAPISEHRAGFPRELDHLVEKCLEKLPDDRWQSAHDVASELEWIAEMGSHTKRASAKSRIGSGWLPWTVAVVSVLALVMMALFRPVPEQRATHLSILPPPGLTIISENGLAISPDGRHLVFSAGDGNSLPHLYIRSLDDGDTRPLAAAPGGRQPFWSPDSRNVGFFLDGELKRVSASGGLPRTVCEAEQPRGGAWAPDGTIAFSAGTESGRGHLSLVDAGGGVPQPLTELNDARKENSHRWPWFVSGGEHLLFCSQTSEGASVDDESTIELLTLSTRGRTRLLGANSSVAYSSEHLLYWHDGSLVAQRFDVDELSVEGRARRLAEVGYSKLEHGAFTASQNGILVYHEGGVPRSTLVWTDREGEVVETIRNNDLLIEDPVVSPDETRIAFYHHDDIWVVDLGDGRSFRLTTEAAQEEFPIWSPDGAWIFYTQSVRDRLRTYRIRSNGTGKPVLVYESPPELDFRATDLSPDGRQLIGVLRDTFDVARLNLETGELETIVEAPYEIEQPRYSPDGESVTFQSDQTGRFEVFVHSLESGRTEQLTRGGGFAPQWSADGSRIYYLLGDEPERGQETMVTPSNASRPVELFVVDVTTEPELRAGAPRKLMTMHPAGRSPLYLGRDESRFLWNLAPEKLSDTPPLTVVLNWHILLE